ncbi:hypothetical protein IQ06DRAFT_97029 [Phaeosphaeriaceae sp. SRC1lsM3a]|nr:hypothetical protein IQ06DRAFT_97029 [Stagonospora sp. SRC1lsM3a]
MRAATIQGSRAGLQPMTMSPLTLSDLCEDIILLICSQLEYMLDDNSTPIKNLSLTSRNLLHVLRPLLFRTLHINKPISQLSPAPQATQHARTFKVDMFGSLWWWCSGSYTSSTDALDLFRCIKALPSLRSLEVSMMRRSVDMFKTAFSLPKEFDTFSLTNISELHVTSSAAFLFNHCPNLKRLAVQDESDCLLETYIPLPARLAPLLHHPLMICPELTSFDATATWSANELDALVHLFPKLAHLRMRSNTYCYRASTPAIFFILSSGLKYLQTLHLVKSGNLGMGYQSIWKRRIQASSNAEYRQMLWRENERLRVEVENHVVRAAFGSMGCLRECWVGEKRVARRLEHEGELRWMWERRREDEEDMRGGESWGLDRFRLEKEGVVVGKEMGC